MEIILVPPEFFAKFGLPDHVRVHYASFVSALAVLGLVPLMSFVPHVCLVQTLFSIPCPGCGVTSALLALMHLNIKQSWQANPAGIAVAASMCFQLSLRPAAMFIPRIARHASRGSESLSLGAVSSLLLVWVLRISQGV